jgi:hypothetical protein
MGQLSVGFNHVCAISGTANSIQCWGSRVSGAIGDGKFQYAVTPTTVVDAPSGITIEASPLEGGIGSVPSGSSGQIVVAVKNAASSTAAWKYAGFESFGDDGFTINEASCLGQTLAPGASCNLVVSITGGELGDFSHYVYPIAGNADSVQKARVDATVVAAPPAPAPPAIPSIIAPKKAKPGKSIPLKVSCAAGCTLNLKLKIGKKSVKVKAIVVAAGQTKATVKLPASVTKKIKAARKKKQKVSLTITPSGGGVAKTVVIK